MALLRIYVSHLSETSLMFVSVQSDRALGISLERNKANTKAKASVLFLMLAKVVLNCYWIYVNTSRAYLRWVELSKGPFTPSKSENESEIFFDVRHEWASKM